MNSQHRDWKLFSLIIFINQFNFFIQFQLNFRQSYYTSKSCLSLISELFSLIVFSLVPFFLSDLGLNRQKIFVWNYSFIWYHLWFVGYLICFNLDFLSFGFFIWFVHLFLSFLYFTFNYLVLSNLYWKTIFFYDNLFSVSLPVSLHSLNH